MANRKEWEIEERRKKIKILLISCIGIVLVISSILGFNFYQNKKLNLQEQVLIQLYAYLEEEAIKQGVEINGFYIETDKKEYRKSLVISGVGTDYAKTTYFAGIADQQSDQKFEIEWVEQIDQTITPDGQFLFPFKVKFHCNEEVVNLFNKELKKK